VPLGLKEDTLLVNLPQTMAHYGKVHAQDIISHFRLNLPSQSLDWCKTSSLLNQLADNCQN